MCVCVCVLHRAESFELVWNTRENPNLSLRKGQDFPSLPFPSFRVWQWNRYEFEYPNIRSSISSFEERNQSFAASVDREEGGRTRVNNAKEEEGAGRYLSAKTESSVSQIFAKRNF